MYKQTITQYRLFLLIISLLGACSTSNSFAARTILIDGQAVTEDAHKPIASWICKDYLDPGGPVLVEVGYFDDGFQSGFVLYDGSISGEFANYYRQGLDKRWDWGSSGGNNFTFTIKPDGTGLYFDFTGAAYGEERAPDGLYNCQRR